MFSFTLRFFRCYFTLFATNVCSIGYPSVQISRFFLILHGSLSVGFRADLDDGFNHELLIVVNRQDVKNTKNTHFLYVQSGLRKLQTLLRTLVRPKLE